MMPTIKNVSLSEFESIKDSLGPDTYVIRICDPCFEFKEPPKHCASFVFEFLDAEDNTEIDDDFKIQLDQAKTIVEILKEALDKDKNVVVHCHAGRCRSGAVAEVGEILGFKYIGDIKQPNIRVKTMLLQVLGLLYENRY